MEGGNYGIILSNKLQPPGIKTKTLRRRRLLNVISRNLDKKLVLLCAGAGYGKTTLLSHMLSEQKLRFVYYHLEKTDAEPVVFFSYFIAGIRRLFPNFGYKFEGLQHLFNYPEKYLGIIVGTFVNEVLETVIGDLYLILEDYHILAPSDSVDKILDYLFDHMPTNLHFIITSRSKPSISLSRMTVRDELFELDTEQLRFTKEEIRRLFKKTYSISLRGRDLDWVERYSEGWPVSLRLMLQSTNYLEGIRSSDHARKVIGNYLQSQVSLFNYFAQEIYFQEPTRIRDFLLDCSVFEWLSPSLCNAATGRRSSARLLSDLTKRNAFIVEIPEHGYRFHHLFRDFLFSKFTDVSRRRNVYFRAANHLSKKGKLEDALGFYLRSRNFRKGISIIVKIGPSLIGQGRSNALCSYVEQIPVSMRNRLPDLLTVYAQALIQEGRQPEAKKHALRAAYLLKDKKSKRRPYAESLYGLGGISLNLGNFQAAKKWYNRALRACPKGSSLARASIMNSLGSLYNEMGSKFLPKAIGYFAQALSVTERHAYRELEASILNNWAMSEWKMGNLNEAYAKLVKITDILEKHFSPGCGAGFFNAARLSLLLGRKKEAKEILDTGMRTCSTYNDQWSMGSLWAGYALLYQEFGDLKKAQQSGSKSLEISKKLGIDRLVIIAHTELCKINIANRDFEEAEKNLSSIRLLKKEHDDTIYIPVHLVEGKLRIAQGRLQRADEILNKTLHLAQNFNRAFDLFQINIELSRLYHLQKNDVDSIVALRHAVGISRLKGYEYLLVKELMSDSWMLKATREDDIGRQYVMSTIKKSKLDVHWVDALLFGVPRVIVDGQEIEDGSWRTMKAKKLFCYLLLHHTEKTTSDTLIDTLWRNVSHRKGCDSLRKAVQYVRQTMKKASGAENVLLVSRGSYRVSPSISVWLDVETFEGFLKQAKSTQDDDHKITLLHKAINLYKRGFAYGWYDHWVEDVRHYYQSRYEECLSLLADFHYKKADYSDAATIYKKLISLNSFDERYHRELMVSLAKLQKYKEIEKQFKKLEETLDKELKARPQTATIELYNSLLRSIKGRR